jgi:hypothetical protein
MVKFFRRRRSLDQQILPLASLNISTLLICVLYSDPLAVSYLQSAWQQDVVRSIWLAFLCLGASLSLRSFLWIHARIHAQSRRVLRLLDILCVVLAIAMAVCCLLAPLPGLLSLSANLVVGVAAVFVVLVVSLIEVFALTTLKSLLVGPGHREGKKSTEAEMSAARLMRILKGIRWLIVMDVLVVLVPAILFYAETVTTLTGQGIIVLAQEIVLAANYMAAVSAFSRPSTPGHLTPSHSDRQLHSPGGVNNNLKSPNGGAPKLGGLATPSFHERQTNAWAVATATNARSNINLQTATLNHHHSNAQAPLSPNPGHTGTSGTLGSNGTATITGSSFALGSSQAHLLLSTPQLVIGTASITAHNNNNTANNGITNGSGTHQQLQLQAALAIAEHGGGTPSPPSVTRMFLQSTTVPPLTHDTNHHHNNSIIGGMSLPIAPLTAASSSATSSTLMNGPASATSTNHPSSIITAASGMSGAPYTPSPLPPIKNGKISPNFPNTARVAPFSTIPVMATIAAAPSPSTPPALGNNVPSPVANALPASSPSASRLPMTPNGVAVTIAFPANNNGEKYTSIGHHRSGTGSDHGSGNHNGGGNHDDTLTLLPT